MTTTTTTTTTTTITTATAILPPDPQFLIPPLLAALPTSFASSKPPPALLPLLSPILQQRVQIHTSTPGSSHDSWLRLLCWDKTKAERLKEIVENAHFEPHPSSGEVEIGEIETITYRRFDEETVKAQIPLSDWDLTALFLWCVGESEGTWKLAELLPFDFELSKDATWTSSIDQITSSSVAARPSSIPQYLNPSQRQMSVQSDDDGYWAMYDSPGGPTPARQGSVNPPLAGISDDDYYAQYEDVQPAMDNHDPDEVQEQAGTSSLDGRALQKALSADAAQGDPSYIPPRREPPKEDEDVVHVNHPVPSSPSSRAGSDTVSRLEESAQRYTASDIAIRQHISTTMKSMYRLAKAAGIPRDDFESMVQRELETLSIFDAHD